MTTTTDTQISRRGAVALAAALAVTAVTAVAAVGGLQHLAHPAATPHVRQVTFVQPSVTAVPTTEAETS